MTSFVEGGFMKKIIIAVLIMLITLFFILPSVNAQDANIEKNNITITTKDKYFLVEEDIIIKGYTDGLYGNLSFWIPVSSSDDFVILVNNNAPELKDQDGYTYIYDLSSLSVEINTTNTINIKYQISKDLSVFTKKLMHNATSINVTFNGDKIFSGSNLGSGDLFEVSLYQPAEAPISTYLYVLIILFIVLIAVVGLSASRKHKKRVIKETGGGSEEFFITKKALLMSLLKELEKQYRAKQISEDTYHKIKDQYKQEAVEIMKKIEDLKSEIK
jgi:preprotein translocase subunit SecG